MDQSDELEPTEELLDLIFFALDHGIESVRASGGPLRPFLMAKGEGKPLLRRFVTESLDRGREMVQDAADRLPPEVRWYAIACDGCLPTEKERFDAIIVEAAERGQPVASFSLSDTGPGAASGSSRSSGTLPSSRRFSIGSAHERAESGAVPGRGRHPGPARREGVVGGPGR
jgi:hypothetical protein